VSLGDGDIRALLGEQPKLPAEKRWPWIASAAAVLAIGMASATSGGRVPLLSLVDFGIHEFGHLLFAWAPWQVTAFAGSFVQVAFPFALAVYFGFRRNELWAAAPLLAWSGSSLRNVAVYIADAPYQRLELWGGEGVLHDWAQLLQGKPMMHADQIAWFANALGWVAIVAAFALALAPLVLQVRARAKEAADEAREETLPVREPHGPIG